MDNGVDASDILKKLVAETGTFTRTFHKTSDIPYFNLAGNNFLGFGNTNKSFDLLIIDTDLGNVGLYCAKWIVAGLSLLGFGKSVEQSRLSDVWVAHNTTRSRRNGAMSKVQNRDNGSLSLYVHLFIIIL